MADPRDSKPPSGGGTPSVTGDLGARIARAQAHRPGREAALQVRQNELTGASRAFRLASEFIAAIIVGAMLGWGFDWIFGTAPWGLVVLLLVGFAAGVLGVVRTAGEMSRANPAPAGSDLGPADDEEE